MPCRFDLIYNQFFQTCIPFSEFADLVEEKEQIIWFFLPFIPQSASDRLVSDNLENSHWSVDMFLKIYLIIW